MFDPFTIIAAALLKKATGDAYDHLMRGYMSDSQAQEEASNYCYVFGAKFDGDSDIRLIGVKKSGTRIYFDEVHAKVADAIGHAIGFNPKNTGLCLLKRSEYLPRWDNKWDYFNQVGCPSEDGYTVIDGDSKWGKYRGGNFRNIVGEYNVNLTTAASAGSWVFGPVGIMASAAVGAGSVVFNRATKNMVLTSYETLYAIVYSRCKHILRSAEILDDRDTEGILIKYEDSNDTGGRDRDIIVFGQFWYKVYVY
jgi:hypothetical protein